MNRAACRSTITENAIFPIPLFARRLNSRALEMGCNIWNAKKKERAEMINGPKIVQSLLALLYIKIGLSDLFSESFTWFETRYIDCWKSYAFFSGRIYSYTCRTL